jgi:GT2 family glycosyltransferase
MFSIIIVNWNVANSLVECLKSILATNYPDLEVIVVDNASSDDSIAQIKSRFPKTKLIQNTTNLGFPRAVNQGLVESKGDYLVILNPDTKLNPDFIVKTLEFFKDFPNAAMMGPKFVDQGSVYTEPTILNTIKMYWIKSLLPKYTPIGNIPAPVNAISGACMIMPRSTYDQTGPLTEEVFMYFEDLDYCRRLRRAHLPIYFNPQIEITHLHGRSASQTPQNEYKYFWETLIYPIRSFMGLKNKLPAAARYHNESAIWYNGWIKQIIITLIILTSQKLLKKAP